MKTHLPKFNVVSCLIAAACLAGLNSTSLVAATLRHTTSAAESAATAEHTNAAPADRTKDVDLKIRVLESDPLPGQSRESQSWLGVATEETSEALSAQLQLDPGAGLTVTYVSPDSPAAEAGLKKNDVLVELDNQTLVHPAQLRKLVQVRKEGDAVKLAYFRAGKKESVSVTLAKAPERAVWFDRSTRYEDALRDFRGLTDDFRGKYGEAIRDQMRSLKESLSDLNIDKDQVEREVRRGVEEARKAVEETVRHATNFPRAFGPAAKALDELLRGGLDVHKDATVTIRSNGSSVKTMVKADDTGTYVLLANPKRHLTVHDKDGKLLFDGAVETSEEQSAVPKDIWEKAEPMVKKMGTTKKDLLPELEQ